MACQVRHSHWHDRHHRLDSTTSWVTTSSQVEKLSSKCGYRMAAEILTAAARRTSRARFVPLFKWQTPPSFAGPACLEACHKQQKCRHDGACRRQTGPSRLHGQLAPPTPPNAAASCRIRAHVSFPQTGRDWPDLCFLLPHRCSSTCAQLASRVCGLVPLGIRRVVGQKPTARAW